MNFNVIMVLLMWVELLRYDAVTYLKYLDTLRVSEGVRSLWMFAQSSHKIFELAKRRVYRVVRADGMKMTASTKRNKKNVDVECAKEKTDGNDVLDPNVSVELDEVLEEAPKWKVLRVSK